jgi:thymidylate kinase
VGARRVGVGSGRARGRPGRFVVLAGPDGSGKSTVARSLIATTRERFTGADHIHWRPELLPRPGSLVGVDTGDPSAPHARAPRPLPVSLAMLLYHWLDFFLGSWLRIVPARSRGALVVMERGWFDLVVDPRRYRLTVPPRLVEALGRLLPAPDVVVLLHADPNVLRGRKDELPVDELERQTERWAHVRLPAGTQRYVCDVSRPLDQVLEDVRGAVASG